MKANNLDELAKMLAPQILNAIGADDSLRKIVAHSVSDSAQTEVYAKHPEPKSYKRRGIKGGLADPDNVVRTGIGMANDTIQIVYENLTEGVDNLKGEHITDVIEEGSEEAWANPDGVWSEPRPFIEPTIEKLKNGVQLNNQLKTVLRKSGLSVK